MVALTVNCLWHLGIFIVILLQIKILVNYKISDSLCCVKLE